MTFPIFIDIYIYIDICIDIDIDNDIDNDNDNDNINNSYNSSSINSNSDNDINSTIGKHRKQNILLIIACIWVQIGRNAHNDFIEIRRGLVPRSV